MRTNLKFPVDLLIEIFIFWAALYTPNKPSKTNKIKLVTIKFNIEQYFFVLFLLTSNIFHIFFIFSIVNSEQVFVNWDRSRAWKQSTLVLMFILWNRKLSHYIKIPSFMKFIWLHFCFPVKLQPEGVS